MWADYLRQPTTDLFPSEYPFLSFGELATVECNISLPDDIWNSAEKDGETEKQDNTDNQLEINLNDLNDES